ncbi:phosphoglucosamine mutase [Methanoregula sp.]|uniref:phosphoglucosamine mutase n=1 Tax=Methanoregula sp. TaxID=2052170 RepID=UPI003BB1DBA4
MTIKKMRKRLFGTNGVRGIVGKEVTPELALRIGEALGIMRPGRIAVGRDTRTSGSMLASAIKAGLLATGCDVLDCGTLPAPALQYTVKNHCDGGAMITASHNPPEYNGVKIIESDGTEMGDEDTIRLEGLLSNQPLLIKPWDQVGTEIAAPHLIDEYIHSVTCQFAGKPGEGMTVVVDPGSGAACQTTPAILQALGCRVITINGIMDGTFPGRLPEPSAEGLKELGALVVASNAVFGVAHDGDADRAVFIDEKGSFVEENQEFALIAQHSCRNVKGIIVTPVSTSQVAEMIAETAGCTIHYTPVGSIYVARTMRELIETGRHVIVGGEGNGGLIFPKHQFCRDGGMTASTMVSLLATTHKSLSSLVGQLPHRYMIKEKISTTHGSYLIEQLNKKYAKESIDRTDGLKIRRQNTWVLIRASGTEPILRIIVDADESTAGLTLFQEIKKVVSEILKMLP